MLIFTHRLAIYYLNAVSKAYKQANIDLKKKMQMVGKSSILFCFLSRTITVEYLTF